jgi:hypothetical protein
MGSSSWPHQRYCQKWGEQPKWQVPQATYQKTTWLLEAPMCYGARPASSSFSPCEQRHCGATVQWTTTPLPPLVGVSFSRSRHLCHALLGVKGCRGQIIIWGGPVLLLQAGYMWSPVPKGTTYILCASSSNIMAASISACACMKSYKKAGISCVVSKDAGPPDYTVHTQCKHTYCCLLELQ